MYDIALSHRADKEIDRLPLRQADSIVAALQQLANWPQHGCDVRPLKGQLQGAWRLRVGDCRVIFSVNDASRTITVSRIATRQQAY